MSGLAKADDVASACTRGLPNFHHPLRVIKQGWKWGEDSSARLCDGGLRGEAEVGEVDHEGGNGGGGAEYGRLFQSVRHVSHIVLGACCEWTRCEDVYRRPAAYIDCSTGPSFMV